MKNPHRILVIEDNPADVTLLRQALAAQNEPFVLEVLSDGEAALDFIRSHCTGPSSDPCLIVLDLHLPRYDGTAVLRAIRAEPGLAGVDVVVVTTIASPEEKEELLSLGVLGYRTKPMDWDGFVSLARDLMAIVPRLLPGPLFWTYFVGAALLAAAISFIVGRCVRWSAALTA